MYEQSAIDTSVCYTEVHPSTLMLYIRNYGWNASYLYVWYMSVQENCAAVDEQYL